MLDKTPDWGLGFSCQWFGEWGLGFESRRGLSGVWGLGSSLVIEQGSGFRVQSAGFRVQAWGLGFGVFLPVVWGVGFGA